MANVDAAIAEAASLLGFASLKEEQRHCIKSFLEGKDVFIILPTGFGKTACFTCLPHAFDLVQNRSDDKKAIIIVISPLTALIYDQVTDLLSHNVSAGYLDSETTSEVKKNVTAGYYNILFMSPEQLVNKWRCLFSTSVYKERLVGLIVDEAHCVVKWGTSFRDAFLRIKEVRSLMPSGVNIMALTATASKTLREKVQLFLGMRNPVTMIRSPEKPNMSLSLFKVKEYNAYEVPRIIEHVLDELKRKLILLPRMIIFCNR
jgi:ATP-dependent DNA helicase RecQ